MTAYGEPARFFTKAVSRAGRECVEWPYARDQKGYGIVRLDGRQVRAHVAACELRNGPRPAGADAAHSCDNKPCFNPNHLRWASRAENEADKRRAGTANQGERHGRAVLTEADVLAIHALPDVPLAVLATDFGVSETTVSRIRAGRTWRHLFDRADVQRMAERVA